MRNRIQKVILISAIVLSIGCAYLIFYWKTGYGIPCPFHLITNLKCPGCGVTRMLVSLIQLDFSSAFRYNAVLLILLPVLIGLFTRWIYLYIRTGSCRGTYVDHALNMGSLVILLTWGVVRNFLHI